MSVHNRLDGFLLERIHNNGAYEAGIYSQAYRLLDAANMIGYLVASFLLPYIAKQWSEKKEMQTVILSSRHFLLMFSVMIITTIFFLAPWVQQNLYHHHDAKATEILQWSIPALIGYSFVQIYGTVMTATGEARSFCYITLLAVVINISLNLLLIPSLGAKGCSIAAIVSQWLCGIAAMVYVNRKTGVNIHFGSLSIYIFTLVILSGLYYWGNGRAISKWMLITAGGMIVLLMMVVTKLFTIKTWIHSLKRSNL
jgi:O-antigen/teichoic acid export membrane protein